GPGRPPRRDRRPHPCRPADRTERPVEVTVRRSPDVLLAEGSDGGAPGRMDGDHASDSDQLNQTCSLVVRRGDERQVAPTLLPGQNQGADHGAVDEPGAGEIDDDGAAGPADAVELAAQEGLRGDVMLAMQRDHPRGAAAFDLD